MSFSVSTLIINSSFLPSKVCGSLDSEDVRSVYVQDCMERQKRFIAPVAGENVSATKEDNMVGCLTTFHWCLDNAK